VAKSKEATTHGGARREARAVRAAERGWFGNGRLGTPPRAPARQAQFERWDLPFVSRPFSAPLATAVRPMPRKGPFPDGEAGDDGLLRCGSTATTCGGDQPAGTAALPL